MKFSYMNGFKTYNKSELFDKVNAIDIFRQGSQVITKYYDKVINTTEVSKIYEVFDIRSFLKDKISHIEKNFNISYSRFIMKRGIQELTLLSDKVEINGTPYYKAFFILSSSDKSRKLNINLGLYRSDNNTYLISGIQNVSLSKRHVLGITKLAEDAAFYIDGETFDEQVKSIESLVGEQVKLSKLREIIVDKDQKINHRKFDAFKSQVLYYNKLKLTNEQYSLLRTESEKMDINYLNDFSIDAYLAFNFYMNIFRNQDSYIVRKETEKILNITQCFVRNELIEQLLS